MRPVSIESTFFYFFLHRTSLDIHIHIHTYICNHENNVLSRLSPQWVCGNSCTWTHDVRLHIAGTNELKSAQQVK